MTYEQLYERVCYTFTGLSEYGYSLLAQNIANMPKSADAYTKPYQAPMYWGFGE